MGPLLAQILNIGMLAAEVRLPEKARHTFSVLITQCILSHVRKLYCSFGAGIHKPVAALWVEFRGSDYFSQFFHIRRFDIDNVEALVLYVKVP